MWPDLEAFAAWYINNRYPIRPPFEDPIYITEISSSYVLFREGQYQVELYLVKPNTSSPEHSHPDVENIIVMWGGNVGVTTNGILTDVNLINDEPGTDGIVSKYHLARGALIDDQQTHALHTGNKGAAILSIEKWPDGVKPSSVTINWKGAPVDAEHLKIIDPLNIKK